LVCGSLNCDVVGERGLLCLCGEWHMNELFAWSEHSAFDLNLEEQRRRQQLAPEWCRISQSKAEVAVGYLVIYVAFGPYRYACGCLGGPQGHGDVVLALEWLA
jgi:hypothetical protein